MGLHRWSRWRVLAVAALLQAPLVAVEAIATTCTDLCGSGSGECVISTNEIVAAGSVIDCGTRDMRIDGPNGFIEVVGGFVTIRAHNLVVTDANGARHIEAKAGSSGGPFGIIAELSGSLEVSGYLLAKDNLGGGRIQIDAQGDINVLSNAFAGKGIRAHGTQGGAPGGQITLSSGGTITLDDEVMAESGTPGSAPGGRIEIGAAGDVIINEFISVNGRSQAGTIQIEAGDLIEVNDVLKAEGLGAEGDGGTIHLAATQVIVDAALSAQGGVGASGGKSAGGQVRIDAGDTGVAINAGINVTSGETGSGSDAGGIVIDSTGPVAIAGVELETKADANGGDGGNIAISAGGNLSVATNAVLDARGHTAGGGSGATISLYGCATTVAAGADLLAGGAIGGTIEVTGRESMTLTSGATLDAGGSDPGDIVLMARLTGTCSNDPTRECKVNADCTIGCQNGTCNLRATVQSGVNFTPSGATVEYDRGVEPCVD
jgi:hypothetical protein